MTIGAEVALGLLQKFVFNFSWHPQWGMWLTVPIILCTSIVAVWQYFRCKAVAR